MIGFQVVLEVKGGELFGHVNSPLIGRLESFTAVLMSRCSEPSFPRTAGGQSWNRVPEKVLGSRGHSEYEVRWRHRLPGSHREYGQTPTGRVSRWQPWRCLSLSMPNRSSKVSVCINVGTQRCSLQTTVITRTAISPQIDQHPNSAAGTAVWNSQFSRITLPAASVS